MPATAALFLRFHDSYGLFIWARLTRPISPWVHMRNFRFRRWAEGQWSWGRVPAQRDKKADMRNTKIITFAPIITFATLKAESLQLIAMLMMRKMQQANTRRCHLGQNSSCFHPVNRAEESYAKFPAPFPRSRLEKTEISGTEPACPVIWTHRGRGKARSRKPGSYEEGLKKIWPAIESVSTRIKR